MEIKKSWIIGAVAVAVVVVLLVTIGPNISGKTTYTPIETDFPVFVNAGTTVELKGRTQCGGLEAGLDALNELCGLHGLQLADMESRPCYYEQISTRYQWDGTIADGKMVQGTAVTAGRALTSVLCVPMA